MVQLDTSFDAEEFDGVEVDMTSVMFLVGKIMYVEVKGLLSDQDYYDYDPNMTDEQRKERRLKSWVLKAVIDGYEALEQKLDVKVIFIHNNCYYAAGDLFNV